MNLHKVNRKLGTIQSFHCTRIANSHGPDWLAGDFNASGRHERKRRRREVGCHGDQ